MKIALATFENSIDSRIVKRGYDYFSDGLVEDLNHSKDDYEATVNGSDDYEVIIRIKNGLIERYDCDCPFDSGPVCKHIVAVLFAIRDAESATETSTTNSSNKSADTLGIKELIDRCPEQELKAFLKAYSHNHTSFVTEFLNAFPNPDISENLYRKQLKALIRKASDRDGFIDWNAARKMDRDLDRLINIGEQHLDKGEFEAVTAICTALMEELIGVLNYADDSSGIIGGTIDRAFEMLTTLIQSERSFAREHLWNFLIKHYEETTFEGWDWHLGMLELMIELADSEDEFKQVQTFLDEKSGSEYDRENKELLHFKLLLAREGVSSAEEFAKKHLENHYLRERLINSAISRKEFNEAIEMAEESIRIDQKDKPGLVKKWQNLLLEIYLEQSNTEKVIEFSRLLFVDGFLNTHDYYSILKKHIPTDRWEDEIESLVKKFLYQGRNKTNRNAELYLRENRFDKLLELVTSETGLAVLKAYDTPLSGEYPSELAELYARELPAFLELNAARNHYQEVCMILKRIRLLGRKDLSDQLINQFRKTYPKRKALIDELNQL